MKLILGMVIVVACVLGGFTLDEGNVMLLVMPTEYLIIVGVLIGALVIAHPPRVVIGAVKGVLGEITGGSAPGKKQYTEMLQMIYELLQLARKEGVLALESHVNEPQSSSIISKYPSFAKNHHAVTFMTDTLKLFVAGALDALAMDELMERDLEIMHHEEMGPAHALQQGADALPAIGIVAAVLGIILTMQSIDAGAAAVGEKVASALVGTFTGILLSYGFVAPMSGALETSVEARGRYLQCLRTVLTAAIGGVNPPMAVEIGRRSIELAARPGFEELEEALKETKGS